MGAVDLVFDLDRGEEVAMKRLLGDDASLSVRFKREFRLLDRLRHPNLVRLHDLGRDGSGLFFTMEHVEGADIEEAYHRSIGTTPATDEFAIASPRTEVITDVLADAATRTQEPRGEVTAEEPPGYPRPPPDVAPLPVRERALASWLPRLAELLVQLLDALSYLHSQGVVHRDIKPSNVRVTHDGCVKLLDFGIIGKLNSLEAGDAALRRLGTVGFMAPEQIRGLQPHASNDAYGVGCLIFRLVTGRPVFVGNEHDVLAQHLRANPPRLLEVVPNVPAELDELCARLLEKRPRARASLEELRAYLMSVLGRTPAPGPVARPPVLALLGRGAIVERIQSEIEHTRDGDFRALVLTGSSGVGKTAIAENQCAGAAVRGMAILRGRGRSTETVPFNAFDGVVDGLAGALALGSIEDGPRVSALRACASYAFPVLADRRVPLPPRESGPPRLEIFSAVVELVATLAGETATLLFIDDLHWADVDSLAILTAICERAPSRVLLLATLRDDVDEPFARAWLRSTHGVDEVRIGPLEDSCIEALITDLANPENPAPSPEALLSAVHACGGRPYLVPMVARALSTAGVSGPAPAGAASPLARAVRESVTSESAALLTLLLVRDEWVRVADVTKSLELPLGELDTLADTLETSGLVKRAGGAGAEGALAIFHDTVKTALREVIGASALTSAHRRRAEDLEALADPPLHRLVRHWLGANEPGRALAYAGDAARSAIAKRAYGLAAEMYGVIAEHDAGSRGDSLALRAEALGRAGRGLDAGQVFEHAASESTGAVVLERQRLAADHYFRAGDIDGGTRVLEALLTAGRVAFPSSRRGAVLSFLVATAQLRLRGLDYHPRARKDIAPDALLQLESCWTAAIGFFMSDQVRGMDFQMRALRLALDLGEVRYVARGLALGAAAPAALGSSLIGDSVGLLERANAAAESSEDLETRAFVAMCVGSVAYLEGRWEDALAPLQSAERLLSDVNGAFWEVGTVTVNMAWSLCNLGRFEELTRWARARQQTPASDGNRFADIALRSGFPNARWLVQGDPARARYEADDAIRRWTQRGFHLQHLLDLFAQIQIDLYERNFVGAAARMRRAGAPLQRSGLTRVRTNRILVADLVARSELALLASGSAQGEESAIRSAIRTLGASGQTWGIAAARMAEAGLAVLAMDKPRAMARLAEAASLFDTAGMALHAAVARWASSRVTRGAPGDPSCKAYIGTERVADFPSLARTLAPWLSE